MWSTASRGTRHDSQERREGHSARYVRDRGARGCRARRCRARGRRAGSRSLPRDRQGGGRGRSMGASKARRLAPGPAWSSCPCLCFLEGGARCPSRRRGIRRGGTGCRHRATPRPARPGRRPGRKPRSPAEGRSSTHPWRQRHGDGREHPVAGTEALCLVAPYGSWPSGRALPGMEQGQRQAPRSGVPEVDGGRRWRERSGRLLCRGAQRGGKRSVGTGEIGQDGSPGAVEESSGSLPRTGQECGALPRRREASVDRGTVRVRACRSGSGHAFTRAL